MLACEPANLYQISKLFLTFFVCVSHFGSALLLGLQFLAHSVLKNSKANYHYIKLQHAISEESVAIPKGRD